MLAPLMLLETRVDLCQQYTAFPLFCFKACLSVTVCVWVPACLFPFISFFLLDPLSLFLSLCLPLLSFSLCLTINVSSACFSRSPACLFSCFFVYFRFVCMYGLCLWLLLILLYFYYHLYNHYKNVAAVLSQILVFWVRKHTTWLFCLCLFQPVHLAQISFQVAGFGHTFTLDLELNQLVHHFALTLTLTQMLWTPTYVGRLNRWIHMH